MILRRPILALLVLAIGAAAVSVSWKRLQEADREYDATRSRLERTHQQEAEIRALRERDERVADQERPPQDVIALVSAILPEVGIAGDRLRDVQPETSLVAGRSKQSRYRTQSVGFTLDRLTPEEIGGFLCEWRQRQRIWIPSRIELVHVRDQPEPARLFTLRVVVTAIYWES
ncbi:MAG: hypothetical protein RL885_12660 [Planctomycetota bacterium]